MSKRGNVHLNNAKHETGRRLYTQEHGKSFVSNWYISIITSSLLLVIDDLTQKIKPLFFRPCKREQQSVTSQSLPRKLLLI